jgi:hypothetical protein
MAFEKKTRSLCRADLFGPVILFVPANEIAVSFYDVIASRKYA